MFRLLSVDLEAAEAQRTPLTLDETPSAIAADLVRLTAQGSETNLWRRLHSESDRAEAALAELAALYLHLADRSSAEWFSMANLDAGTRDLFFSDMVDQTMSGLRKVTGAKFKDFARLLDQRRSEYARCRELTRGAGSALDGTVLYAFYKHLLTLGPDAALLVMAELNLEEVETLILTSLAEVVDRPEDLATVSN